jgi:hypothetical protein
MQNINLGALRQISHEILASARVAPGASIPGWTNTTPYVLHLPGGNNGYPAFWVRDAAMMMGSGMIEPKEIEGWVKLIASVQPGADGLHLKHGLIIPPYSIPDHITLNGEACWYPGAMAGEDQGNGAFGFLPPADDAFYFIQMVREHQHITGKPTLFLSTVQTPWGNTSVANVCEHAFDSVDVNKDGCVVCDSHDGKTRVDWGFCDTVRKTGACLMPTLLRWKAARDLSELFRAAGFAAQAKHYSEVADIIRKSIVPTFHHNGVLLSATGLGRKDDVWTSSYAVWLGVLPPNVSKSVATHLDNLYKAGGVVLDGQVRALPPSGEYGGYWEQCVAEQGLYQNGAYWGTPAGWFITTLSKVDKDGRTEC